MTKSLFAGFSKIFSRDTSAMLGTLILASLLIMASLGPFYAAPTVPIPVDLQNSNLHPFSPDHFLGTDYLGRDVLALTTLGARVSISIGLAAAFIACTIGSFWGTGSALAGGIVDRLLMTIVDGLLSIPSLLLLLCLQSLIFTPDLVHHLPLALRQFFHVTEASNGFLPLATITAAISATSWLESARIAHARVQVVKNEEYVQAGTAIGASFLELITRHLLPNAAPVLLVEAGLLVADAVLMESGLSFLGLGLDASTPSWGTMLNSAQLSLLAGNWWSILIPGLMITFLVLSINLLVDSFSGKRGVIRPHV